MKLLVALLFVSIGLNMWLGWKTADSYSSIEAGVAQEAVLFAQLRDLTALVEASKLKKDKVTDVLRRVKLHPEETRFIEFENVNTLSAPPLKFHFGIDGSLKKVETSIEEI